MNRLEMIEPELDAALEWEETSKSAPIPAVAWVSGSVRCHR
jgi:hypothetical protein